MDDGVVIGGRGNEVLLGGSDSMTTCVRHITRQNGAAEPAREQGRQQKHQ